jgi:hypothetical protein
MRQCSGMSLERRPLVIIRSVRTWQRAGIALTLIVVASTVPQSAVGEVGRASDPPLLVPWSRIGDIALGESRTRVEREYGPQRDGLQPQYRLHGGTVWVRYAGGRVVELDFTTPYYRTTSGFGVGSTIPLGPCHRTPALRCEHRWHGFVFNAWNKATPCNCWVKVGLGAESLGATTRNFLKPWFFIYTKRGRVSEIYLASKFVD